MADNGFAVHIANADKKAPPKGGITTVFCGFWAATVRAFGLGPLKG